MSLRIGNNVYALFEGSRNYYPAVIVSGPNKKGRYEVRFSNGEVNSVKENQIKTESAMRSTSKSPSRKRAPARSRSRSRSRSRGRSPGRSPGRARSKSPPPRKAADKTPKREATPPKSSRQRKLVEEAKPNHNQTTTTSTSTTTTRHSARIAAAAVHNEKRRSVSVERQDSKARVSKTHPVGLSGTIGALICALSTPPFLVFLVRHCSKKDCSLLKLPSVPKTLSAVFDLTTAGLVLSMSAYILALSVLPFGRLVDGPTLRNNKRLTYRCNGLESLVVTLIGWCIAAFYFKYPVAFFYEHTQHLLVVHIVASFILSTLFYVKARRAGNGSLNPNGNSGNIVYDWFAGHELNPRIGPLDLKFVAIGRCPLLCLTLYNASLLAKACTTAHAAPSNTLLAITGMQLLYALHGLWYEEEVLYRWDMRHAGYGHLTAQTFGVLRLVMLTIPSRFVFSQDVQLSNWLLLAILLLFVSGYVIYRGASLQKFYFRKNPFDPFLAHLESIPTSSGKRLLSSGWWGLVRHPNYLGEVVMGLAWCLTCGWKFFYPYIYLIYLIIVLVLRALRDDCHMKKSYGSAWSNYAGHVRHRIFPYVW